MADLTEKKFGPVIPPPRPHPVPFPPAMPIPPGMTMQDWMSYINSYIDVRARQLYDKLKSLISASDQEQEKDYILLKDWTTHAIHRLYIDNGIIYTREGRSVGEIPNDLYEDDNAE